MKSENNRAILCYAAAALSAAAGWFLLPLLLTGEELSLIEYYCINAVQQLLLFAAPALLILRGRDDRWQRFVKQIKPLSTETLGYTMLGTVSCTVVASLIISFWLPLVEGVMGRVPETPPLPDPENAGQWIAAVLCIGIIPGFVEELFFRSVLQTALVKRFSGAGIVITAVIFALLHLDIASFPGLVFMGFLLGKLYERRGLIASGAFHGLYNLIVLVLNSIGTDIGFLEIFLCVCAFRFAMNRLMREDEEHAVDGTGV